MTQPWPEALTAASGETEPAASVSNGTSVTVAVSLTAGVTSGTRPEPFQVAPGSSVGESAGFPARAAQRPKGPSTDTAGLIVGAFLPRDDPRDALCGADALRRGMRIGTASVRRRAQLLALEPTLSIEPLRGNIDTRLRKRGERGLDAVVLAACGLDRLVLAAEIGRRFDPIELLPEAGQGALAIQVRAGEEELVGAADDPETRRRVEAERACLAAVGGGCLAPVAAHHDGVTLTGLVADEEGRWVERRSGDDPVALGEELARLALS